MVWGIQGSDEGGEMAAGGGMYTVSGLSGATACVCSCKLNFLLCTLAL